jgi:hypothetical protein
MNAGRALAPSDPEAGEATHRNGFCVGGVSVGLSGASRADVSLTPPLEPFRATCSLPDIEIRVAWVGKIEARSGRQLFDSGSLWKLYENQDDFQFDFRASVYGVPPYKRLTVDRSFRRAVLQMNEECFVERRVTADPLEYPLDELLITHRLTIENGLELHGCGVVGPEAVSNLFIGHSGAGKSTTSRLWAALPDVRILSDDRIILRKDLDQFVMYGTPWHGEAAFALPERAPLKRVCVLEHGHGNVLTRLSPSQAVAELFARSFVPMHRHEYVESALECLQSVAESVPCYRYSFEPDPRAVEKILNLRD